MLKPLIMALIFSALVFTSAAMSPNALAAKKMMAHKFSQITITLELKLKPPWVILWLN